MAEETKLRLEAGGPSSVELVKELSRTIDKNLEISLQDPNGFSNLTPASINHFRARLAEFGTQVLLEARSIEKAEHVGSGSPEITAAHIDEAWWVTRRRVRRMRHPFLVVCLRLAQILGGAGFGAAASNLRGTWGPAVFIISALGIMGGFLLEVYFSKSE